MNSTNSTESAPASEVVTQLVLVYGGIFLALLTCFTGCRTRHEDLYSPRKVLPEIPCPLANEQPSHFLWIKQAVYITDEELFVFAGLDAVAFVRFLHLGLKVSLVCCFNAIYLIPIYVTSSDVALDELDRWTLGYLPTGSPRMYASVVAAYVAFGYAMFLVYQEFAWFIKHRHRFMQREFSFFFYHCLLLLLSCFHVL
jgi:hypothetical protein